MRLGTGGGAFRRCPLISGRSKHLGKLFQVHMSIDSSVFTEVEKESLCEIWSYTPIFHLLTNLCSSSRTSTSTALFCSVWIPTCWPTVLDLWSSLMYDASYSQSCTHFFLAKSLFKYQLLNRAFTSINIKPSWCQWGLKLYSKFPVGTCSWG